MSEKEKIENKILKLSKESTMELKGIAILFVILGHMGYQGVLGVVGVHIFLVVSGYGIYYSFKRNGFENFWNKRILSVYVPYLVWQIPSMIIRRIMNQNITLTDIFATLLGIDFGHLVDQTM